MTVPGDHPWGLGTSEQRQERLRLRKWNEELGERLGS